MDKKNLKPNIIFYSAVTSAVVSLSLGVLYRSIPVDAEKWKELTAFCMVLIAFVSFIGIGLVILSFILNKRNVFRIASILLGIYQIYTFSSALLMLALGGLQF